MMANHHAIVTVRFRYWLMLWIVLGNWTPLRALSRWMVQPCLKVGGR